MLRAKDVSDVIRRHLAGGMTRAQLADWAHAQFVKDDAEGWFDPSQSAGILAAVRMLMVMEEGPEFEIERRRLEGLARSLEGP